ncbi:hypothetical protein [Streptomyces sp. HB2AG]|uniref:hypothetical protein n=1 Tax=Streptomyces sp. HB2AG TaxID=2983400 RepID=UPI0022AA6638|nr:hypothetical protein [Streptomyces sp. HB2AG]MCZ2527174.1 hypothetical protein [Streptomyces sp. HB2AG]
MGREAHPDGCAGKYGLPGPRLPGPAPAGPGPAGLPLPGPPLPGPPPSRGAGPDGTADRDAGRGPSEDSSRAAALLRFPAALALAAGRTSTPSRTCHAPSRLLTAAGLALYAVLLVNTVPRLLGASRAAVGVCTCTGIALTLLSVALVAAHSARDRPASGAGG